MLVTGIVVVGSGQAGKSFGLPTANIQPTSLDPGIKPGVYATKATLDEQAYKALTFIGQAHLLEGKPWRVETHLFRYSGGNMVGKQLDVELLAMLRDPVVFTSNEQAIQMIADDVRKAQTFFLTA